METSALVQRLSDRLHDGGAQTVAQRVIEELWLAVVDGTLESGERLPTARELAIALNVSPRSIERAYEELEQRGVTANRAGAGTFISLRPPSEDDLARHQHLAKLCRQTVESATALGFGIDELLDCLAEYRTMGSEVPQPERPS
jgi:DNA-binding transcriptional regulator YhcF (GntR family)